MRKILLYSTAIITVLAIFSGITVGAVVAYVGKNIDYGVDEELFRKAKDEDTSYYYAYNLDNELIEVYKSSYNAVTEWTDIDNIGEHLKNGFIAMEDRDFYSHNGVNLKRTVLAMLNHLFKFKSSFGASTITQQVIKNISGDNETTVVRKIKEILRAFNLERNHSKDDIFEVYLNIIPMSGNISGVGAAAEIYFGKEPRELSLAEAATIVGITNAPTKYNPYLNPEGCKDKRNKVLYAMLDVGYIDEADYKLAISEPLILSAGRGNFGISSWFIETANEEILTDLSEKCAISRSAAKLLLHGSKIILTMNPDIQRILEDYFGNTDNLSYKFGEGLNYAMIVSNPYTGDLLGVIGNGGKKTGERLFNYATTNIIPGSVLKPIAIYAPLIEDDKISWSTLIDDSPTEYIGGEDGTPYPKNTPDVYEGTIDINEAIKKSKNTVAVRLFDIFGAQRIFNHLKYDFGIDSLVEGVKQNDGTTLSDLNSSPLALGQLTYGASLRKLTEAYNVFPAEGVLHSGRSYIEVYDREGELILSKQREEKRIYSRETAQVMNQLLSNVVSDGTARQIRLKELVDVAGKTGTSGNDRDRLFVGYTPYFTAGIWCGYSNGDKHVGLNSPSHIEIWDRVMHAIHENLIFSGYSDEIQGFSTDRIVIAPYCSRSGDIPSASCELDEDAELRLGCFKSGKSPEKICEVH